MCTRSRKYSRARLIRMNETVKTPSDSGRKSVPNTIWIASERVASSMLGILSILAVTRLLGVVSYGHYAFSLSILGVGLALGHLGLDGLLIKKLVENPNATKPILGTVSLAKYIIYIPLFVATFNSRLFFEIGPIGAGVLQSLSVIFLILPISSSLIAWLHAHSAFRQSSLARICAIFLGTTAKIGLILAGLDIVKVGFAHSAIFVIELSFLLLLSKRLGAPMPSEWHFNMPVLRPLFAEGLPLFLASLFAMFYINFDVIALRILTTPEIVGEYALVQQVLQASQILPFAIALAAFPMLVAVSKTDLLVFFSRSARIMLFLTIAGLTFSAVTIVLAPILIPLVFGERYLPTAYLLQTAAAAFPFIFIRQLTTKMFICLKLGWRLAVIEGAALAVSGGLNITLIPLMSSRGSAIAVVGTYAFTSLTSVIVLWASRAARHEKLHNYVK